MRFLVLLLLTFCWSATGFSQKQTDDLIVLKSVKTSVELKQLPLQEKVLIIDGRSVTAAEGYQIVYSKKMDYAWVQATGDIISMEDIVSVGKGVEGSKMSNMTAHCNGVEGCSCTLKNIGSDRNPVYSCTADGSCSCTILLTPDKGVFDRLESADGNWFDAGRAGKRF